ncbi:MAG: Stk1 family PASTA domain-containing Ser/Thr kinase [Christensenellales bacterium]|jgi:beta-lactam-binding protein with PASTA domain/tRNA A-37 threonylcarbamoyl transferase component Bud32
MDEWVVAQKYKIISLIGTGGSAHVYKAENLFTGEIVAIKMLRPELSQDGKFIRQFRTEAEIGLQFNHRNIVRTLEVGEEDGGLYIVMEYVHGQTLKSLIQKEGSLTHHQVVDYGSQICEALAYAHGRDLVHRDIKPQNMLIDEEGTLKVMDFGIARIASVSTMTMSGRNVVGSVHYISPEQARGAFVDNRSDLYSFGIVLFEMATGRVPFEGENAISVAIKHINDRIMMPRRLNAKVPRALELVIFKATQKKPEMRYQTAQELLSDIVRTLDEPDGEYVSLAEAIAPRPAGEIRRESGRVVYGIAADKKRKAAARRALLTALIIFLVLLIGGGAIFAVWWDQQAKYKDAALMNTIPMPNLITMSEAGARAALDERQLLVVTTSDYSDTIQAGCVMWQDPAVDTLVTAGDTVYITISLGQQTATLPSVVGISMEEAQALLEAQGFIVGTVRTSVSDKKTNTVLMQTPPGNTLQPLGTVVDLVVAADEPTEGKIMPKVTGMTRDEALDYLNKLGFVNILVEESRSATYMQGLVCQQYPEPDEPVEENITLTVSLGLGGYSSGSIEITLEITQDNTHVVILFDEGGEDETKLYDEELEVGSHGPIVLTPMSAESGVKIIRIYYNNVLEDTREITMTLGGD